MDERFLNMKKALVIKRCQTEMNASAGKTKMFYG